MVFGVMPDWSFSRRLSCVGWLPFTSSGCLPWGRTAAGGGSSGSSTNKLLWQPNLVESGASSFPLRHCGGGRKYRAGFGFSLCKSGVPTGKEAGFGDSRFPRCTATTSLTAAVVVLPAKLWSFRCLQFAPTRARVDRQLRPVADHLRRSFSTSMLGGPLLLA